MWPTHAFTVMFGHKVTYSTIDYIYAQLYETQLIRIYVQIPSSSSLL